jgi:hypothetical protein
VLTFTEGQAAFLRPKRAWRIIEILSLCLGTFVITQGVYGEMLPPPLTVPIFILPFLLWAALRFGPRVAAVALLIVAVIGVWNTNQGRGPYTLITALPAEQLIRVQATLSVVIFSIMTLAAAVAERRQVAHQRIKLISELEQALAEIKTLQGLIPICGWCKKIRDDQGLWQQIEVYLRAHTSAKFSHGICPECLEGQLADLPSGGSNGTT